MKVFLAFLVLLTVSSFGETYQNNEISNTIHQKLEDLIEKTLEDEIDKFSPKVEDYSEDSKEKYHEDSDEDQEIDELSERQDPWRGRVRIRGRRIIREVTRPIRQTVDVVRRVVPVRVRVRRFVSRIGRKIGLVRSVRFRSVPPPNPPPRPAQCRAPNNACPSDWNVFDDYEILEVFTNACGKFSICNTCAANRKWSLGSCLNRFLGDMKNLCAPFNDATKYPGWYDVCIKQASKFQTLAKSSQKSVASPAWCSDSCVAQRGGPNVEIKA